MLLDPFESFDIGNHSFLEVLSSLDFKMLHLPGFLLTSRAAPSLVPWLLPSQLSDF